MVTGGPCSFTIRKLEVEVALVPYQGFQTAESKFDQETLSLVDLRAWLPEHVQVVFESIPESWREEELKATAMMVILYEDIFARHDFDLGHFGSIGTQNRAP